MPGENDGADVGGTATGGTSGASAKPAPRRRGRPKSAAASSAPRASATGDGPPEATIIKKYANRRLYDTGASRYVTLEDLAAMVREGRHFTVLDAKSGEDITRPVLGQIIFEQEAKDGPSLLPTEFLRQVISYYGDGMGAVVPSYLEASMRAFERGAEDMREELTRMAGGRAPDPARMVEAGMEAGMAGLTAPLKLIEEQTRRNQEAFASAMRMFTPFGAPGSTTSSMTSSAPDAAPSGAREATGGDASAPSAPPPPEASTREDDLAALREQIGAMQRKLDGLGE